MHRLVGRCSCKRPKLVGGCVCREGALIPSIIFEMFIVGVRVCSLVLCALIELRCQVIEGDDAARRVVQKRESYERFRDREDSLVYS